jgi:hypothetical protein
MNAAAEIECKALSQDLHALGDVDDFAEACAAQAWFVREGWDTLQHAVDYMQSLAELWELVSEIGQDAVQEIMAEAFCEC